MSTPAVSTNNAPYFQATIPSYTHVLDYTNSAADLADAFQEATTIVEVFSTTDCWVRVKVSGSSDQASAVASGSKGISTFCPGGIVRFIGLPVTRGVQYTLSVVRKGTNGTIYVNEAA